jgi:pimeloyl-ACP methyl ester carboxylesterase
MTSTSHNNIHYDDTLIPIHNNSLHLGTLIWSISDTNTNNKPIDILAWPGGLDNAGSFQSFAPILIQKLWNNHHINTRFIGIDPPGCGRSSHLPISSTYSDFEEIILVIEVAKSLGLLPLSDYDTTTTATRPFILFGHSRGGGILSLAAGVLRKHILALIIIESGMGLSGTYFQNIEHPQAPSPPDFINIAYNTLNKSNITKKQPRIYKTIEDAITANAKSIDYPKSFQTATNIVLRQLRPCAEGGWTLTLDPRLTGVNNGHNQFFHLSEDYTCAFLSRITCPVLRIMCSSSSNSSSEKNVKTPSEEKTSIPSQNLTDARTIFRQRMKKRLSNVHQFTDLRIVGGHHVHSDSPVETADMMISWLIPQLRQMKIINNDEIRNNALL